MPQGARQEVAKQVAKRELWRHFRRRARHTAPALARLAHDTNNALAAILANLELAERYAPQGKAQDAIGRAADAARLHAALLPLHAPDTVRHANGPEPLDVGGAVAGISRLLTRAHGGSLRLETDFAADLPPARVEAHLVDSLVAGLVCGLRPKLGEETTMRISAAVTCAPSPEPQLPSAADGSHLKISICAKDDGAALAHAWAELDGSARGGLLASVVRLVSRHGGSASLAEHEADGTQIVLRLPLHRKPATEVTDAATGSVPLGDGELVLLAGEDGAALEQLHRRIEGLGYSVVSAAGETEALALTDTPETIVVLGSSARERDLMRQLSAKHPNARTVFVAGDASEANAAGSGGLVVDRACTRAGLATALGAGLAPDQASRRTSPTKT